MSQNSVDLKLPIVGLIELQASSDKSTRHLMQKNTNLFFGLLAVGSCLITHSASGAIVFSFEAAGVQATTVAGAVTETFDTVALGQQASYISAIGTYTPLRVSSSDIYGGAGGTRYMNLNPAAGPPSVTTLTFANSKTYFGMWWSAGDATDKLEFYSGATLVGTFNVGSIIPFLTSAYYGNPNQPTQNTGEPYAYVNFTGVGGTTFDKVVFTETDGGGFETDNHSVFDQVIEPPGIVVPEPSTIIAGALLLVPFGVSAIRRFRK